MFCSKCGKQIVDDSIFCSYCGVKICEANANIEVEDFDDLIIKAWKDCVTNHLKAPSTVSFHIVEIQEKDNYGRIYLYVEIDAQNAFGAYLRNKLRVVLQCVNPDGTYEALDTAVSQVSFFATEDVVKSLNKWNKPK